MLVLGRDKEVTDWVAKRLGYPDGVPAYSAIGYERNGGLCAGVYFDGATETNIFAHIATDGSMLPVELLGAVAAYAFHQCRANRMTFMVADNNFKCLALVQSLGAVLEGRIHGGHRTGDVLLFALWSDCSFHQKLLARGKVHG